MTRTRWEMDTCDWPLIISEEGSDGRLIATIALPDGSTGIDAAGLQCVADGQELVDEHNALVAGAIVLDGDELANVLAAVRNWQEHVPVDERAGWEHFGDGAYRVFDDDELDALCDRLNGGE